jgi:spore coat polysaccharide biosynthesis protein SpsF (cytidylyltransferase family)
VNTVILCTRNGSTRLPGKATAEVSGKPILQHIVERYQSCRRVDRIVVATTTDPTDDAVAELCSDLAYLCYRGSVDDVVCRMSKALERYAPEARYVFRGLGDMPLFDVDLLDWRFDLLERRKADVVWCGLQGEPLPVYGSRESPWSRRAWDRCVAESSGDEREHAGQWIYRNMRQFHVVYTEGPMAEYYAPYRLELDTPNDLAFFRAVYGALYRGPGTPRTLDLLRWLDEYQRIAALNMDVETKTLTEVSWRQRGEGWNCNECGAYNMRAARVKRGKMVTECAGCGAKRIFVARDTLRQQSG